MTADDDKRAKRPTRAALRRELRLLARDFADQLVTVLDRHGMWDEAAVMDEPGESSRIRRSTSELEKVMARILDDLHTRKEPVSIGKVAATLGLSSRQVAHPMSLLVDEGKVMRSGERRGARYQVVVHKPAPKRRAKKSPRKR